jgi:peptidoglycan/xylan/chitin deacetylase (PgdA/CDA1 family)
MYLAGDPFNNFYDIAVKLHSGATNAFVEVAVGCCLEDTWVTVDAVIDPASFGYSGTGTFDPTAVTDISIQLYSASGKTQIAYIDKIWATFPNQYGLVTFTFDDGLTELKTRVIPHLDLYGYSGVLAVFGSGVDSTGYLTKAELNALQEKGWDIVSHGYNHRALSLNSKAVCEDEVCKGKGFLTQNGFYNGPRFYINAYTGQAKKSGYDVLRKYMLLNRTTSYGINTFPVFSPYYIQTIPLLSTSLAAAIKAVDAAVSKGVWPVFYAHTLDTTPWATAEMSQADFLTLLAYVQSKNCKVVTFSEIYDKYMIKPVTVIPTSEVFMDCLDADTAHAHALATADNAAHVDLVSPDVARNMSYTIKNNTGGEATGTACTVTYTGVNAMGMTLTDTVSYTAAELTAVGSGAVVTKYTNVAFAKITSVQSSAAQPANWQFTVGISDKLGLSKPIVKNTDVYKVKVNTADATVGTVSAVYGTVDCATITDGDDITISYKATL